MASCTPLATPLPSSTQSLPIATSLPATPTAANTAAPPTAVPDTPILPSEIALDPDLITHLKDNLAAVTQMSAADIRLAQIETGEWRTDRLGCGETSSDVVSTGTVVRLLAGQTVYTYHVSGDQIERCDGQERIHGDLLTRVDPVALEIVLLAQQHVAQTLDLPTRRIRLVDVISTTWPDTSLGCPAKDQTYTPRDIDGYRVVVGAGDETYAFHSDTERLIPCEADREVLPAS